MVAATLLVGCDPAVQGEGDEAQGAGGSASTTASSAGSAATSSSTGGDDDHPRCVERDPALQAEVTVTLSHWAPDRAEHSSTIELHARCVVRAASPSDPMGNASLDCTDDAGETFDAELSFGLPPDVTVALEQAQPIDLELAAHSAQGEVGAGMRFAIRDEGGDLVVAVYDDETYAYVEDSWSSMIAPLQASVDLDLCPSWTCPTEASPECPDGGTFQRHGLVVSAGDERVHLVDGRRDVLSTESGPYEVLVGSAAGYFEISSRFSYRVLVARRR